MTTCPSLFSGRRAADDDARRMALKLADYLIGHMAWCCHGHLFRLERSKRQFMVAHRPVVNDTIWLPNVTMASPEPERHLNAHQR